jgi:hypothetical protein
MYEHAPIIPGEALSPRVRASLVTEGEKQRLPLPCVHHDGTRCTEYEGRPSACSRYACRLLGRVERGEVELGEARAIVAQIKAVAEDVRSRLPEPRERMAVFRAARAALSPDGRLSGREHGPSLVDLGALAMLIRRELDPDFARHDDAESSEPAA